MVDKERPARDRKAPSRDNAPTRDGSVQASTVRGTFQMDRTTTGWLAGQNGGAELTTIELRVIVQGVSPATPRR